MPVTPRPNLTDRLLRYTAIASAVTAGGILSTPQAHASSTVREINVTIDNIGAGDNDDYFFDFDLDGNYEADLFMFEGVSFPFPGPYGLSSSYVKLLASTNGGDKLLGVMFDGAAGSAAVLSYLDPINAAGPWGAGDATLQYAHPFLGVRGNWQFPEGNLTDSTQGAYLGVSLQLDGAGPYYGWVELYYPDREHITIKRIGYGDVAGQGLPASVDLLGAQSANGWQGIAAVGFAVLGGVLAWIRHRLTVTP